MDNFDSKLRMIENDIYAFGSHPIVHFVVIKGIKEPIFNKFDNCLVFCC